MRTRCNLRLGEQAQKTHICSNGLGTLPRGGGLEARPNRVGTLRDPSWGADADSLTRNRGLWPLPATPARQRRETHPHGQSHLESHPKTRGPIQTHPRSPYPDLYLTMAAQTLLPPSGHMRTLPTLPWPSPRLGRPRRPDMVPPCTDTPAQADTNRHTLARRQIMAPDSPPSPRGRPSPLGPTPHPHTTDQPPMPALHRCVPVPTREAGAQEGAGSGAHAHGAQPGLSALTRSREPIGGAIRVPVPSQSPKEGLQRAGASVSCPVRPTAPRGLPVGLSSYRDTCRCIQGPGYSGGVRLN